MSQLICNAGEGVGKYSQTVDNIGIFPAINCGFADLLWTEIADSHFQVNHLSQFHLLRTLFPVLQRTSDSRLVLMSSDLHRACPPKTSFTSLDEINTDIGPMNLYSR